MEAKRFDYNEYKNVMVYCTKCGWEGKDSQLVMVDCDDHGCPKCESECRPMSQRRAERKTNPKFPEPSKAEDERIHSN